MPLDRRRCGGEALGRGADPDLSGDVDARELADRRSRSSSCSTGSARSTTRCPIPCARRGRSSHMATRSNACTGPRPTATGRRARRTLRFTEAFVLQTALLEKRAESARAPRRAARARAGRPPRAVRRGAAVRAHGRPARGGRRDRRRPRGTVPMNRLVQGEVGSGKTVVALRAMLAVAESGGQSALLAPTEVLAGAAPAIDRAHARPRALGRAHAHAADRPAPRRRAAQGAPAGRRRPVAHRRRHARAPRRHGLVRRPGARRRRRAAPLRRRAARGAAAQGAGTRTCSCSPRRRSRAPSR